MLVTMFVINPFIGLEFPKASTVFAFFFSGFRAPGDLMVRPYGRTATVICRSFRGHLKKVGFSGGGNRVTKML